MTRSDAGAPLCVALARSSLVFVNFGHARLQVCLW